VQEPDKRDPLAIVAIDDEPHVAERLLDPLDDDPECSLNVIDVMALQQEQNVDLILSADLILVDHELRAWSRNRPPQPSDGLALLRVLQRYIERSRESRLCSTALFSAELKALSELPDDTRAHVLARVHGFEWAFAKRPGQIDLTTAVKSLAQATATLREAFRDLESPAERMEVLLRLLAVDDVAWRDEARLHIERCRPPVYEVAGDSHGAATLRWLLQRILPYPTFLYDMANFAARLGLPRSTYVQHQLALDELFQPARYTGILADFAGPRYWRFRVDATFTDLGIDPNDARAVRAALDARVGTALPFVAHARPVPVLDETYQAEDVPVPPNESVRVLLDDWPTYAEPARVSRKLGDSPLRGLVVDTDRRLLPVDD